MEDHTSNRDLSRSWTALVQSLRDHNSHIRFGQTCSFPKYLYAKFECNQTYTFASIIDDGRHIGFAQICNNWICSQYTSILNLNEIRQHQNWPFRDHNSNIGFGWIRSHTIQLCTKFQQNWTSKLWFQFYNLILHWGTKLQISDEKI